MAQPTLTAAGAGCLDDPGFLTLSGLPSNTRTVIVYMVDEDGQNPVAVGMQRFGDDGNAIQTSLAPTNTKAPSVNAVLAGLKFIQDQIDEFDYASQMDFDALKDRIDAILAGADADVDSFLEVMNRFLADESALNAITTALGARATIQYVDNQVLYLQSQINTLTQNQVYTRGGASGTLVKTGWNNTAPSYQSAVLAGESSNATGQYSTVVSGYMNNAYGHWSTIVGGTHNKMNATANGNQVFGAIIGSNYCETNANFCSIYNSSYCTIGPGCDFTTLIGCTNLTVTTGSNQMYVNNQLYVPNTLTADQVAGMGGYTIGPSADNPVLTAADMAIDYRNESGGSPATIAAADPISYVVQNNTNLYLPQVVNNPGVLMSIRADPALTYGVTITPTGPGTLDGAQTPFRIQPGEVRWIRKPPSSNATGAYFTFAIIPPPVQIRSATAITLDADAEYQTLQNGSFTVNPAYAKPGVCVNITLGVNCQEPDFDSGVEKLSGTFQAGQKNMYSFLVTADGTIVYRITQRP